MREILFRGKTLANGEWIYGDLIRDDDDVCILQEGLIWREIIPESVGEYTGLKDKNGTRIFEGDIVTCDYFCGVVYFHEGTWCVTEEDNYPEYLYDLIDLKIIGNIHDNPELLKGE